MPRKSTYKPGFEKQAEPKGVRACGIRACSGNGEYRAPKSRSQLDDYIWLCLDHIREYNRQWDYFKGLKEDEILQFQKDSVVGHRPSWQFGMATPDTDEIIRRFFLNFQTAKPVMNPNQHSIINSRERKALNILGLDGRASPPEIKKKYKALVKLHHPDINQQNPEVAAESFRKILEAYDYLKKLYNF